MALLAHWDAEIDAATSTSLDDFNHLLQRMK
jgi:hypothetical protein